MEDKDMNTIEHEDDPSTDGALDAQRDIIRQSINEIANDIGIKMRDGGLTFPLYITVRNSGDALVTIATPLDPPDTDWQRAREIVCRTLQERVGCGRLGGRELACAIANAGAIHAADVTACQSGRVATRPSFSFACPGCYQELRRLKVPERSASAAIFSPKGPWRLSSSSALHRAFTNKRFKGHGLFSMEAMAGA
jgi:hypothetical protein